MVEFLKGKFDLMLVTIALVLVFSIWINLNFEVKLEPYVFALFGSWLTVLGLRPRPNITNTDTIKAENIESAVTETGDIFTLPTSKAETKKKEKSDV